MRQQWHPMTSKPWLPGALKLPLSPSEHCCHMSKPICEGERPWRPAITGTLTEAQPVSCVRGRPRPADPLTTANTCRAEMSCLPSWLSQRRVTNKCCDFTPFSVGVVCYVAVEPWCAYSSKVTPPRNVAWLRLRLQSQLHSSLCGCLAVILRTQRSSCLPKYLPYPPPDAWGFTI